jgi:hypothetical protein
MTLYFLRTQRDPIVLQHRHANWDEELAKKATDFPCKEWESLPHRYFRLVMNSTRDRQFERWDVSQIERELERLQSAVRQPKGVVDAELLAEELTVRSVGHSYRWNSDKLAATVKYPTGLTIEILAEPAERRVRAEVQWMRTGAAHYSRVTKWIGTASSKATSHFRKAKWDAVDASGRGQTVTVAAHIDVQLLKGSIPEAALCLRQVMKELSFE